MQAFIDAEVAGKWPKCGRKLLYTVLSLFCFITSAAAFIIGFMMFCPDCAFPNMLLLWVHLVGAFLLFAIGMKTFVTVIFSRARQNTPPARVLISEVATEVLENSTATLDTHRMPPRLLFILNSLHSLTTYDRSQQNQATEDLSWRDLPDYFTALQNMSDTRAAGDTYCNEAFCTEDAPMTPPPCYEEALEMKLIARPASNEENAHLREL